MCEQNRTGDSACPCGGFKRVIYEQENMGAPGGVPIRSWGQEWQPVARALSGTFWAIFTKPRPRSRILRKTPLVAMIEGFKGCGCCRHLRLSLFLLSCS